MNSSFSGQMTYICGKQFLFFILVSLVVVACEARGLIPASDVQTGFIGTSNTQFVLNGSPFLFNGFNSYWMMNVAADPTERYKISDVFQEASAAGLTVCRTWAFNDGGDGALQMSPGVYNERVFQALNAIYRNIYNFARTGGTIGGGLVWQLVAEGMESYYDGYEIVLSQNPSTSNIIIGQSRNMEALGHMLGRPQAVNSLGREDEYAAGEDVHNHVTTYICFSLHFNQFCS